MPLTPALLVRAGEAALPAPRWGPLGGLELAATLGCAEAAALASLPDEDKVQVAGDAVFVSREPIEALARAPIERQEAEARAVLYFVHELAHPPQGIGRYADVQALRAISEEALLRLDLAADHVAALAWQRITDLPLSTIKALQARSLEDFPVTGLHSPGSRWRKACRQASLLADIQLAAPEGPVLVIGPPTGGPRCVLRIGAGPDRLLAVEPIQQRLVLAA